MTVSLDAIMRKAHDVVPISEGTMDYAAAGNKQAGHAKNGSFGSSAYVVYEDPWLADSFFRRVWQSSVL
jgi:hypothetical protein